MAPPSTPLAAACTRRRGGYLRRGGGPPEVVDQRFRRRARAILRAWQKGSDHDRPLRSWSRLTSCLKRIAIIPERALPVKRSVRNRRRLLCGKFRERGTARAAPGLRIRPSPRSRPESTKGRTPRNMRVEVSFSFFFLAGAPAGEPRFTWRARPPAGKHAITSSMAGMATAAADGAHTLGRWTIIAPPQSAPRQSRA